MYFSWEWSVIPRPFKHETCLLLPVFLFLSFHPRRLIIAELELLSCLLSFVLSVSLCLWLGAGCGALACGVPHARLCSQVTRLPLAVKCLDFSTAKQHYWRRSFSEAVSHVSSAWVYWIIPEVSQQHSKERRAETSRAVVL